MKSLRIALSVVVLLMLGTAVFAQTAAPQSADQPKAPDNPLSAFNRLLYAGAKNFVLRSAEKMPEENYSFKPTETVRSFGQIIGHVADAQYRFCSVIRGEKNPAPQIEKTKTSKADLSAALKDAFAYCDKAYDGLTDASAALPVKFFGRDGTQLGVLTANTVHTVEHYGNLITYLRMKNIVPPSSEPGGLEPPKMN